MFLMKNKVRFFKPKCSFIEYSILLGASTLTGNFAATYLVLKPVRYPDVLMDTRFPTWVEPSSSKVRPSEGVKDPRSQMTVHPHVH
jgi:hypothetical protein